MKILPKLFLFLLLILNFSAVAYGQYERKQVIAVKTDTPPLIDGNLSDRVWEGVTAASDFFQYEPKNSGDAGLNTEVRFLYDNNALYIGAMMYDSLPEKITRELGFRDSDNLNTDYISIEINPFDDGLNGFIFMVSSSGVQVDKKITEEGEDVSWNAVWKSNVAINDSGWSAEFSIPYSALRFSKEVKNGWGLNIWRIRRSTRETFTWNFVDKKIEGAQKQTGIIVGFEEVKPPTRLSFHPYVSGYVQKKASEPKWLYSHHYGMDFKYGLSESFTLDMTLIPDFGQVQSDDQVYNLTPFEIYYEEKRPFFTEGTELFQKGNIFYSRRVGALPIGYFAVDDSLKENEYIKINPTQTNLINATKLSGRTANGFGIGVFNAVSANTYATLSDSTGNTRKIITQPVSNFNMIVLDQNLKNNSYISLYNTNVYKGANYYTANVSGVQFLLFNKPSTYSLFGRFNLSQQYNTEAKDELGIHYNFQFSKTKGQFRFNYSSEAKSDTYNPNDLGFIQSNNSTSNMLELNYNFYNPFWKLLRLNNSLNINYQTLYDFKKFTDFSLMGNSWATFKNHLSVGFNFFIRPVDEYDYYESRTSGKPFIIPPEWQFKIILSPDYRKPFIVDFSANYSTIPQHDNSSVILSLSPRMRINDRFTVRFKSSWNRQTNDYGYVTTINTTNSPIIIMGRRNLENVENIFQTSYIFSNHIVLDFRLRHYWLGANYLQYFNLENNGRLGIIEHNENNDFEVDIFNIDLLIRWEFSPGSELAFVWKNAIQSYFTDDFQYNYFRNLGRTLYSPSDNSLSIKLLYYLDYLNLKNK